jgi:hypothetical protein
MSWKAVTESDPSANWGHFSSSAFQCLERSVAESDDWKSAAQLQNSHLADPIQQLENYIDAASATLKIAVAQHLELHSLLSQIDQFPRTPRSCVTPPATGLYHASTPSPTRKEPLPSTTCLTQLYAPEQRSPKPCTDHYTEENNDNWAPRPSVKQVPVLEVDAAPAFLSTSILFLVVCFCTLISRLHRAMHQSLRPTAPLRRMPKQGRSRRNCRVRRKGLTRRKIYSLPAFLRACRKTQTRQPSTDSAPHYALDNLSASFAEVSQLLHLEQLASPAHFPPLVVEHEKLPHGRAMPSASEQFTASAAVIGSSVTFLRLSYGLNDGVKELWGQPNTWTDWQCSCGFINFERRLECLQCTKPKLRAEGFAHDNAGATCLIQ